MDPKSYMKYEKRNKMSYIDSQKLIQNQKLTCIVICVFSPVKLKLIGKIY